MRQEKTVLSDSQVAELRLVYKTMTIEQLCCKFHVGTVRLYEILRENGMDDRMPMKKRKTEVIKDAQVRKEDGGDKGRPGAEGTAAEVCLLQAVLLFGWRDAGRMVHEVPEAGEEVGLVLGVPPSPGWPVRAGDSSVELSTMKPA